METIIKTIGNDVISKTTKSAEEIIHIFNVKKDKDWQRLKRRY